jgi:hypothetical protein
VSDKPSLSSCESIEKEKSSVLLLLRLSPLQLLQQLLLLLLLLLWSIHWESPCRSLGGGSGVAGCVLVNKSPWSDCSLKTRKTWPSISAMLAFKSLPILPPDVEKG